MSCITFDDLNDDYVPYSMLERLLDFLDEVDIRGTLFAIPMGQSNQPSEERYIGLLKEARLSGHEIALHGYAHRNGEFGIPYIGDSLPIPLPTFERQRELLRLGKEYLEESLGEAPVGFRAPMYRHTKVTLEALASLGFKYDSSKTVFKPAYGMRFRLRTRVLPRIKRVGSILEIPVTADYTYNLLPSRFEQVLEQAKNDFRSAAELGGIFVINNHIQRSGQLGLRFLRCLTDELRVATDFVRLEDMARAFLDQS